MSNTEIQAASNTESPVTNSNGREVSLAEISMRANKKSRWNTISADADKNDIYKKYKGYFFEIAKALHIDKDVKNLKKNNMFSFEEKIANRIVNLLLDYERQQSGRKKHTAKGILKQIIKNKQYNMFLPQDIIELQGDIVFANNFIVTAMEVFYDLFISKGYKPEEVEQKLSKADQMYLYSKRKCDVELFDVFHAYLQKLTEYDKQRHLSGGLTEKEQAIWMDYSNRKIKETMERMTRIRKQMLVLSESDWSNEGVSMCMFGITPPWVENARKQEEKIIEELSVNRRVNDLCGEYEMITKEKFNLERLVAYAATHPHEETVEEIVLSELLGVPSHGDVVFFRGDSQRVMEIIFELYQLTSVEVKLYKWETLWESIKKRDKNEDLLFAAIKKVDEEI